MDTYINLGTRFKLDKQNKELIDTETGEILKDKDEIQTLLKTLQNDKKINRTVEKAIRDTWELQTKSDKYHLNWKQDSWFIKIYRTEMREYMKNIKLSSNAGLLFIYLQPYIEYGTNKIIKSNNKNFTNKDLQRLTNLGRDSIKDALNELEKKLFIIRKGNGSAREIYFNPYLICSGNEVLKEVALLFNNAGYNPVTPF